ncbi:hypothetical protein JM98_01032 [Treponema putidum]|nr:hypothetical protein [Treponema putidum]TWI77724.1 hypothetical protein JM98_01032 [Treponema putidum]
MIAKAGDVYCVYNKHLKKYTACQITKIEEHGRKPQAVILLLDWSGDRPLKMENDGGRGCRSHKKTTVNISKNLLHIEPCRHIKNSRKNN